MLGVGDPQHVAGELDERMLEPAAGAEERDRGLTRPADRAQRAVHARVGTARRAPDAVEVRQSLDGRLERRRGNPLVRDLPAERPAGVLEGLRNGQVGVDAGVAVADHGDARHACDGAHVATSSALGGAASRVRTLRPAARLAKR